VGGLGRGKCVRVTDRQAYIYQLRRITIILSINNLPPLRSSQPTHRMHFSCSCPSKKLNFSFLQWLGIFAYPLSIFHFHDLALLCSRGLGLGSTNWITTNTIRIDNIHRYRSEWYG